MNGANLVKAGLNAGRASAPQELTPGVDRGLFPFPKVCPLKRPNGVGEFLLAPIIADALEDAGCDSADVLDHCRGSGPHVRGCWVVDLVLGKG
jgi:hypothetical protein